MAYTFQDIDPENIDFKQQSDEARKKRLAAAAAVMGGGSFTDMLGQFATDRVNQATNNVTQLGQALENPEQAVQQRLGMQPQVQQPVGPVMPQEISQQRQQELPIQQFQPQVQVQPQQQEQVTPVTPEQVQQTQLPQPGPGVQVAGPTQLPPAQQTTQPMPSETPEWHNQLVGNDFKGLSQIVANPNTPEDVKMEAQDRLYNILNDQRLEAKANKTLQGAAQGNQKDMSDLTRELNKKSSEGSLLKAMFYSRMGLSELAKDEQQKLGAGVKYEATVGPNNTRALIKFGADNMPISGFDETGKLLSQEDLAKFAANAMPTKAHLMPSVHGSPVVNSQGEIGTLMYDPRSQSNYVQVGNERRPTTGWTTMAQNVQNVYNQAQAGALGKGAGEGFTPQPMKPLPGSVPQVQPNVSSAANPQLQAQPLPGGGVKLTPTQGQRVPLAQQATVAPQPSPFSTVTQPGGAVPGLPAGAGTQTVPGSGIAQQKANLAIQEAQQKEGIQVAGARSQAFNKILDEEVRPQAQQGDTIVSTRKQQFQIFDRPGVDSSRIFGIANGAGQAPGDQRWTMLRDVLIGKTTATDDQIRERAAQLGLNREEQSALAEYAIANAKINAATLKSTAGAGSVSDAEQRANREMNVDPTKIPAMGAYNAMAQSQFEGDKARYKADWAATHPATNALQLDKAWRKESQMLTEMYTNIAKERIKFIVDNGSSAAAVKEAYKRYPIPEYDPATEKWKKTKPLAQILGR